VAGSLPVKVIAVTYLNFESSFTTFISTQVVASLTTCIFRQL
jgi:hypothetical protein